MKRKEFYLVDYKGKFDIICDKLDDMDWERGRISRKQAIEEAHWRLKDALYFGVPAYIGKDKELKKAYKEK